MDLGYTSSREPYPGLRPFSKEESDIFFGRDDHISEMIAKLSKSHFLCITGSSGCGKSSLARTGLMNHLEAGFLPGRGSDWIFCDLHPGDHPVDNLFRGIADSIVREVQQDAGGTADERSTQIHEFLKNYVIKQRRTSDLNTVLDLIAGIDGRPITILVDQFEELFRYIHSDSEAAANLVEILLKTAAAQRNIYIVITIRTDELEKCSRYPGLTRLINDSQFLTPVLDRYQIQQAIEGPITLWGGRILPDLSTWLLNCLEDELDKLPLMQHALRVLYAAKTSAEEGHKDVTIGLDDFVRVFRLPKNLELSSSEGRLALRHTLSDRLTQQYDALPDRLKPATRQAFCALTAVDSRNRDIRQPQKLGTLAKIIGASIEDTQRIVRQFSTGDEIYLRVNRDLAEGDTVDVTHECILRLWQPLQAEWLVDEKRSGDNLLALARLARDWRGGLESRSRFGNLFAGAGLKWYARGQYQAWFDKVRPNSDWAVRYLGNVDWPAPPDSVVRKVPSEAIYESIVALLDASRRQRWLFAAASVLVVLGVIAGVSIASYQIASSKAREARRLDDQIIISGLKPEQTRVSQVESTLEAFDDGALADFGAVWAKLQQVDELYRFNARDEVHAADFAPDGKSVLAIDKAGILHQWAVAAARNVLREIDFYLRDPDGGRAQGRSLAVSPLGDVASIGFNQGSVVLLDLTSAERRFEALQIDGENPHGTDSVFKMVFSFDGALLVSSSRAGNIAVWERSPSSPAQSDISRDHDPLRWTLKENIDLKKCRDVTKKCPSADIWAVDIDRAKQTIAVGLGDGHVCLLWLDDLDRPSCPDQRSKGEVKSIKFLPNKSSLVSAGNDAKVTIWDFDASARTAKPLPFTLEHDNSIWDIDVNSDGSLLATADFDGSVRVYQTGAWRLLNTVAADRVASSRRHQPGDTVDNAYALRTVRFDASSTMLVTSSLDHTARVWTPLIDRASIRELSYRLPPAEDRRLRSVYSVAVSPTGDEVAFTDQAAVYVQSSGQLPKALPSGTDAAIHGSGAGGGQPQPKFSQVLMRTPNEIVASSVEPRLAVWTKAEGAEWLARAVALPGDRVPAGRGVAFSASGNLLGVEVRDGEVASVLLCPLRGGERWSCSPSENPEVTMLALKAKLPLLPTKQDCASGSSEVHIALSRSERLVAVSAGSCPIQIFDLRNRNQSRFYTGHQGDVNTLDFAPDETAMVASSQSSDVRIWELASGMSRNINYHASPYVTAARYSPSGKWIASTSNDNSVIVSSASSGDRLVILPFRNSLFDLAIANTARGLLMVTGSKAGDVNVGQFFEDGKDISSYAKSVLHDVSP